MAGNPLREWGEARVSPGPALVETDCPGLQFNALGEFYADYPEISIYYGGDSGYFLGYQEIGKSFRASISHSFDHRLPSAMVHALRAYKRYRSSRCFSRARRKEFHSHSVGHLPARRRAPGYAALDLTRTIEASKLNPSRFIIMDIGEIRPMHKAAGSGERVHGSYTR